jgi:hypothetical protein
VSIGLWLSRPPQPPLSYGVDLRRSSLTSDLSYPIWLDVSAVTDCVVIAVGATDALMRTE